MFTITVDGQNITSLIALNGCKWSDNDIDGENAGRNMQGGMILDFITNKQKLELQFKPLTDAELQTVKNIFKRTPIKQTFSVTYNDGVNTAVTLTMYKSSLSATFLINKGTINLWNGVQVHLIEV